MFSTVFLKQKYSNELVVETNQALHKLYASYKTKLFFNSNNLEKLYCSYLFSFLKIFVINNCELPFLQHKLLTNKP